MLVKIQPRTFWVDLRQHGLWTTVRKRWFGFTVSGRKFHYKNLASLPWDDLEKLANKAAEQQQKYYVCWAFEAMLTQSKDLQKSWLSTWSAVRTLHKSDAANIIHTVLRSIDAPEQLAAYSGDKPHILAELASLFATESNVYKHRNLVPFFLQRIPLEQLQGLAQEAAQNSHQQFWEQLFQAHLEKSNSMPRTWHAAWSCLEAVDDEKVIHVLNVTVDLFNPLYILRDLVKNNLRAAFLLGKVFAARAQLYRTSNEELFDYNRNLAIEYYAIVQGKAAQYPEPNAASNEAVLGSSTAPFVYAAAVGAAYEETMYMQFQKRVRSSSSSIGGG